MSVISIGPSRAARCLRGQKGAILLVLLSCAAIGAAPTLTKLAFDGGSDAISVVTARNIVMAVILAMLPATRRHAFRMPIGAFGGSLAMGPVYLLLGVGYLGSVAYIPVSLAILIYFLHPLLIGLAMRVIGHEAVSWSRIATLCLALGGLAIAIGAEWAQLNPAGLGLAFMSAIACTVMIVGNAIAMKHADSRAVTFWMVVSAAVVTTVFQIASGGIAWPGTIDGWVGFIGVGVAYSIGLTSFFAAIPRLGATRATMLTNIEPLLGIVFAMIVLGERITDIQAVGMMLVFIAICAMELLPR